MNGSLRNIKYLIFFTFLSIASIASFALPAFAAEYHVTTGGSSSAEGTASNPWDLQTALSGGNENHVVGGDTIWVHGGTYIGQFTSSLIGRENSTGLTSDGQVLVRNYNGERATLDGGTNQGTERDVAATLMLYGGYTTFMGLEVMTSATDRVAALGGWIDPKTGLPNSSHPIPSDFNRGDGIGFSNNANVPVPGMKIINMIIHDNRQGISLWAGSKDAEIHGNLVYNDGWISPDRGHGHGLYAQNSSGGNRRTVSDNIFWGQFSHGTQVYSSDDGFIDNYSLIGNVYFGHNENERGVQVGGGTVGHNETFDSNMIYNDKSKFGQYAGLSHALMRNNYISNNSASPLTFENTPCSGIDAFSGNTILGPIISSLGGCNPTGFLGNTFGGTPSLKVFVRKNTYEEGRANITIFNPNGLNSVNNVDLSGVVPAGTYQLHNAENYYGDVKTIDYSGGAISISMEKTSHSRVAPIGYQMGPFTTFPYFGAFILTKSGAAGATPTPTPALSVYSLTVNKVGSGTVSGLSSNPQSFPSGTVVTLTATPVSGNSFSTWNGCGSVSGSTCSVTMSATRSVTASFNQITVPVPTPTPTPVPSPTPVPPPGAPDASSAYTLTVIKPTIINGIAVGSVVGTDVPPKRILCGDKDDCVVKYAGGTTPITLTAWPAKEYTFKEWGGDCKGTGSCVVTMNAAHNVTALFCSNTGSCSGTAPAPVPTPAPTPTPVPSPVPVVPASVPTPTPPAGSYTLTITRPPIVENVRVGTVIARVKDTSTTSRRFICGDRNKCTLDSAPGKMVTLTAWPAIKQGYVFKGWGGNVPASCQISTAISTATCVVKMDKFYQVTASFALK